MGSCPEMASCRGNVSQGSLPEADSYKLGLPNQWNGVGETDPSESCMMAMPRVGCNSELRVYRHLQIWKYCDGARIHDAGVSEYSMESFSYKDGGPRKLKSIETGTHLQKWTVYIRTTWRYNSFISSESQKQLQQLLTSNQTWTLMDSNTWLHPILPLLSLTVSATWRLSPF